MEEIENNRIMKFTKQEYEYLEQLCNSMYKEIKKLPKKMRTEKFYILENIINNHFTK